MCVVSLATGVAVFVGMHLLTKAFEERTREELVRLGANILVLPSAVDGLPGDNHPTFPESYVDRIRNTPNAHMLRAVSPKLSARGQLADRPVAISGITVEEAQMKLWWRVGGRLASRKIPTDGQVLLGSEVGARAKASSAVQLLGKSFKISGVLDPTGSADDRTAFVSLPALQTILGKAGEIDSVGVSTACISCPTMTVFDHAQEIAEALPPDVRVVPVKQIAESQVATLRQVKHISTILAIVVLVFSTALVLNQLYGSVSEQQREIGIFMSLGMTPRQLYRHFVLRGLLVGLPGGVLGLIGGLVVGAVLGPSVVGFMPVLPWKWVPVVLFIAGGLGALASLPAARRATHIEPGRVMREAT